jgi:hypothetical protein
VPTPDFDDERDGRFEGYLKKFRPLAIESLPIERPSRVIRRRFVLMMVGAAAAVLLVAALLSHSRAGRTDKQEAVASAVGAERLANTRPLTMRSANALLATAPSFEAAVDEMAFPPQTSPLPKDQHSALAVLSEERIKL